MLGASRNAAANIVINAKIKKNFSCAGYARLYKKRGYYYSNILANAAALYSSLAKQQFATPPCYCYNKDNKEHSLDSLNLFLLCCNSNRLPLG
jgi:hypothetical protein